MHWYEENVNKMCVEIGSFDMLNGLEISLLVAWIVSHEIILSRNIQSIPSIKMGKNGLSFSNCWLHQLGQSCKSRADVLNDVLSVSIEGELWSSSTESTFNSFNCCQLFSTSRIESMDGKGPGILDWIFHIIAYDSCQHVVPFNGMPKKTDSPKPLLIMEVCEMSGGWWAVHASMYLWVLELMVRTTCSDYGWMVEWRVWFLVSQIKSRQTTPWRRKLWCKSLEIWSDGLKPNSSLIQSNIDVI